MKTKKLISFLLSTLLLCSAAAVPGSAAEEPNSTAGAAAVQKSRDENSAKGTFFLDLGGNWSVDDRISFYIWAKTDTGEKRFFYQ